MTEELKKSMPLLSLKVVRENACGYEETARRITGPDDAAKILDHVFALSEMAEEVMCMVTLDTQNQPTGFWIISIGSLNESIVHPREVFKRAMLVNSYGIILGHNHPSGDPSFSPQDRNLIQRLLEAGKIMGIRLMDFIAVGAGGNHESASRQGLLSP